MNTNTSNKYSELIEWLDSSGQSISPSLRNSVCPADTRAIVQKFLDAGIPAELLTEGLAKIFDYEVYDRRHHGNALRECAQNQWLLADRSLDIFFVANPFAKLSPGQVLEQTLSRGVRRVGLLPVAVKQSVRKTTTEVQAESSREIERWLHAAADYKATDIHIVPLNGATVRVLYRIDGQLRATEDKPVSLLSEDSIYHYICNMFLRLCGLEAGMFSRPADGKFNFALPSGEAIDVRLSMRPVSANGVKTQSVWLRLLRQHTHSRFIPLRELGLANDATELLLKFIRSNQNLVLLTGPTGSGKSTTLYSALQAIQQELPWKSIQTLEDPIESHMEGVSQTQISSEGGMSFARGLRSMMRTDVDVILIGEIRDDDTARLAVRAALTGHLVLATIHCKAAIDAIGRMLDFGVSPQLLATVLAGVFAQRLVRRVCQKCSALEPYDRSHPELFADGADLAVRREGRGCQHCRGGYAGRLLVSEALPVNRALADAIVRRNHQLIHHNAAHSITLWRHASELIRGGATTLEECRRHLPARDYEHDRSSHELSIISNSHMEGIHHATN